MFLLNTASAIGGIILACMQFFVINYIRRKGFGLWVISLAIVIFLTCVIAITMVLIKINIIMALYLPGAFAVSLNIYVVIKFLKLKTGGN
jgi:heme A synthase